MKRILSLFAAFAILLSLSACQPNDMGQSIELVDEFVSETSQTIETTEMKTIEPPEDGWTLEELNNVIKINGINYSFPVTLGTLAETYTYDNDYIYTDKAGTIFYYNNTYAFGAGLEYNDIEDINNNSRIISAIFTILDDESQIKSSDLISVNGVKLGDTYENMINQLGEPDIVNENYSYKYVINNKIALAIYFFNSKEIQTIQISWEE